MAAYNYYGQNYGNPYFGYPMGYQAPMQQPIIQNTPQIQQPQQQAQSVQATNQIQNGGFITVRSEAEARNYPVAPGMSVTFKHETAPYCYTKTMGFNQFEAPHFEKFRLVKEEEEPKETSADKPNVQNQVTYATEDDFVKLSTIVKSMGEIMNGMKADVDNLKSDMYGVAGKRKAPKKVDTDQEE